MSLGSQIRKGRNEKNLTQLELGHKLITKKSPHGVDSSVIANWENDKRRPRTYFLQKLSEILGKPISWFFEEVSYPGEMEKIKSDIEGIKTQLSKVREYIPNTKQLRRYRWGWQGDPKNSNDYYIDSLEVSLDIFRKLPDFIIIFEDEYLKDLGIVPGDNLLIKKQDFAYNGDLVLTRVNKELMIRVYQKQGKNITLLAAPPKYPSLAIKPDQPLTIIGKVIGKFREY